LTHGVEVPSVECGDGPIADFITTETVISIHVTAVGIFTADRTAVHPWSSKPKILRSFWAKRSQNGGFREQNRGRGSAMLTPTNSFLLLAIVTFVPFMAKIDQEMRP